MSRSCPHLKWRMSLKPGTYPTTLCITTVRTALCLIVPSPTEINVWIHSYFLDQSLGLPSLEFCSVSGSIELQSVETLNQCFTRCACYLRINLSCDSSGVTWTAKRLQRCMNGKFSPLAWPQALAVLFTSSKGSSRTHKQMSTLPIPYTTASTWIAVYKIYLPQRKPKTFFTVCALPSPLGALKSDNGPVMILRSSVTYLLKPGQNKQSSGYHTILLLIPQSLH